MIGDGNKRDQAGRIVEEERIKGEDWKGGRGQFGGGLGSNLGQRNLPGIYKGDHS